jgi:hypothetical protein
MPSKPTTAENGRQVVQRPPIEDVPSVEDAFADDFVGLYRVGPNYHFTFAAHRPAKSGEEKMVRLVNARLVLPLDAVLEMYNALGVAVKRLEKSGLVKKRGQEKA